MRPWMSGSAGITPMWRESNETPAGFSLTKDGEFEHDPPGWIQCSALLGIPETESREAQRFLADSTGVFTELRTKFSPFRTAAGS